MRSPYAVVGAYLSVSIRCRKVIQPNECGNNSARAFFDDLGMMDMVKVPFMAGDNNRILRNLVRLWRRCKRVTRTSE